MHAHLLEDGVLQTVRSERKERDGEAGRGKGVDVCGGGGAHQ